MSRSRDCPIHIRWSITFFFALATLVILVVAAACPWYDTEFEVDNLGSTESTEFMTYQESKSKAAGIKSSTTCDYTDDDCAEGDFKTMYALITTCIILSIVLVAFITFVALFFAIKWCHRAKWRGYLRIPVIIMGLIALLTATLAWCLLFWHPAAIRDGVESGAAKIDCDSKVFEDTVFCKFAGDSNGFTWGPSAGWGLTIVATVSCAITCVLLFISGSPDGHGYMSLK
eukprot:CAMPEP_0174260098 /NCGR_PEP_ID=MMETSP0439-20130205/8838_1 /TAXON_ID=0 /ORGANISM="Stereomyxa ramosa, Strain Chinc5" /LENGTH=228 /DNA_ID=CAMNT_0015344255 /DNA_START=9 /DNA_END=695 /DNA_ORIENTATION=-